MVDKQHTFMNNDEFDQYEEFYDFTEENRRIAKRFQSKFGKLAGGKDQETTFVLNPKKPDGDEDNWEEGETKAAGEKAEEENVSLRREYYKIRKMKVMKTGELKLPSGKIAGHRDYIRYYKQTLDIKEDENPVQAIMRDRAMQRKFIRMQMVMVGKTTNMEENGIMMVKKYNYMLHQLRKKIDRISKHKLKYRDRRWVK